MKELIPFEKWHIPLSSGARTLDDAYQSLRNVGLRQDQIPFLVQLVENPRYDVPGIEMFPGATDLETHDHIHIILGRGLLPKDEAFVLGFTLGSTNRLSATEEKLYEFFTRHLYPRAIGSATKRSRCSAMRYGSVMCPTACRSRKWTTRGSRA